MTSWNDFIESLDDEQLPAAKPRNDVQKFPCQQCGGTGLWTARRANRYGNDKCNACTGRGYFLTDENTRRKARTQRVNRAAKQTADAEAAFEAANPGLLRFLNEAGEWSEFAASLAEQARTKHRLSERQLAAANSMRAKVEARKAAKAEAKVGVSVDLQPVRALFETAVSNGYKKPTFRAEGLVISRAGDTSRNPGALYVKADGEYMGKLVEATFQPVRSAPAEIAQKLQEIAKNPMEAAVRYGRQTGTCSCCGRELTNKVSIELGIGPICREKWGL